MKASRSLGLAVAFLVTGLIIGLVISANIGLQNNGYTRGATNATAPEVKKESLDVLSAYSSALVDVVSSVTPSVVNISTTKTVKRRRAAGPDMFMNDPFFRRFFGEDFSRQFEEQPPQEDNVASLGSGVIVDAKGYILTNNHVIKDADEIMVRLSDNREFKGTVVGTDLKTDIAVVKVEVEGSLPAIKWGDSDKLRVGELVIAVGSPYGLNQTVTSGIVSAKGRANVHIADYEDFIQTDAAINPGNSGGPLINIRGELVGINTAIFSTSGGYQGIGFSIPSNMVRAVMDSLIKYKKVVRGWLGVTIQPINKKLAEQFKLDRERGALISDTTQDGPAEAAGIKRGDIIVEYQGKEVADATALRNMVANTPPETVVELVVVRDGQRLEIKVRIGELPSEAAAQSGQYTNALAGVAVQNLTPEVRKSLGINKRVSGVIVTEAPPEVGLRRGDVILEVNRKAVASVKEYDRVVSTIASGEDVLLVIYRDGMTSYLNIQGR